MDISALTEDQPGSLVAISDTDPKRGPWKHYAFQPDPLPETGPVLSNATHLAVGNARAALAALDSTARRLPNPRLLRRPTLRFEAQATSALEGTYEPLSKVLTASDDPDEPGMREIINYEMMALRAFSLVEQRREITVPTLSDLQLQLVKGTRLEKQISGQVRPVQVVIGRRPGISDTEFPVKASRFIPPPPGIALEASLRDLLKWLFVDHSNEIDPVTAAAMVHYQFETLHPFHDGNGRIGRLLIVVSLHWHSVLSEPTLTVSPWFEARRSEYEDLLSAVSTRGEWDNWIRFFANGIAESARATNQKVVELVEVQRELKETIRQSSLRADSAHAMVDLAVARVSFTVRGAQNELGLSYGRANDLVSSLCDLGILTSLNDQQRNRRFYAPRVMQVLVGAEGKDD